MSGQTKCLCNDLFQIQCVHLQRITGPDGHWMNNATPAERHSAIKFSLKKENCCEKEKTPVHTPIYQSHTRMCRLISAKFKSISHLKSNSAVLRTRGISVVFILSSHVWEKVKRAGNQIQPSLHWLQWFRHLPPFWNYLALCLWCCWYVVFNQPAEKQYWTKL